MESAQQPAQHITVNLEIADGCNIHCRMCQQHDALKRMRWMPLEKVRQIVPELAKADTIFMGNASEQLINPEWEPIFQEMTRLVPEVGINTNAKMIRSLEFAKRLVGSGLAKIQFSIDGTTDETVSKVRRGITFTEIARAIDLINEAKAQLGMEQPILLANAVAMRSNLAELPDLTSYLSKQGIDLFRIGFLQVRSADSILGPESLLYARQATRAMLEAVRRVAESTEMKLDLSLFEKEGRQTREQCDIYRTNLSTFHDGQTSTCWGGYPIGNIFKDPVITWFREQRHVEDLTQSIKRNPMFCGSCTYCNIMDLDTIEDHFGPRAIRAYSKEILEASIDHVQRGGSPEQYFEQLMPTGAHQIEADEFIEGDPGSLKIIDYAKKRFRFHSPTSTHGAYPLTSVILEKTQPESWQNFFYNDMLLFGWSKHLQHNSAIFTFGNSSEIFSIFAAIHGDSRVYAFLPDPAQAQATFTNIQYNRAVHPKRKWEVLLLPIEVNGPLPSAIQPLPDLLRSTILTGGKRQFFISRETILKRRPQRPYTLTELVVSGAAPPPIYLHIGTDVDAEGILQGAMPLLMEGFIHQIFYSSPGDEPEADQRITALLQSCNLHLLVEENGHLIYSRS